MTNQDAEFQTAKALALAELAVATALEVSRLSAKGDHTGAHVCATVARVRALTIAAQPPKRGVDDVDPGRMYRPRPARNDKQGVVLRGRGGVLTIDGWRADHRRR